MNAYPHLWRKFMAECASGYIEDMRRTAPADLDPEMLVAMEVAIEHFAIAMGDYGSEMMAKAMADYPAEVADA